ncbi:T9SS type A sorting domain-containing protein [Balneolales bacterium ANBcel1]|nr:T9SS type A sorting domain-containing protein [Balneolales bacterium ANBcel1]
MEQLLRPLSVTLTLFLLPVVLSGSTITLEEHGHEYHITGTVIDPGGDPVPGLIVDLVDAQDVLIDRDTTSAEGGYSVSRTVTSADPGRSDETPGQFELEPIYPNPTGGQSILPVRVAAEGVYRIELFSVDGRLVTSLEERMNPGRHTVHIGMPTSAGSYLVRVRGNGFSATRQVTSLSGSGARLAVVHGSAPPSVRDEAPVRTGIKQPFSLFDTGSVTLKVHGDGRFEEYSVHIDTPGTHEYDIVLQPAGADPAVACANLQPAESGSVPARYIELEGLGEEFGQEPMAWFYDATTDEPDEDARHPAFIERIGDGGEARVAVPLHPVNLMEGGAAHLVIVSEDESVVCEGIPFEIEPMAPAPGTLTAIADDLEDMLLARAAAIGYTKAELLSTDPATLTPDVLPIAAGFHMLEGEGFSNNIRAIINGDAPIAADTDEEAMELMEAALTASGYAADFAALIEELSELPELEQLAEAETGKRLPDSDFQQSFGLEHVSLSSAQALSNYMSAQARCANANTGAAQASRVGGGLVLTGVAFLVPPSAPAAGVAALNLFLMDLILGICEDQYPSKLRDIQLTVDPASFYEDSEDTGEWEASLQAEANGFTLTWPDAIGAIPGLGKVGEKVGSIARQTDAIQGLVGETTELVQGFATAGLGLSAESGPINYPATIYGPLTIDPASDEDYFTWEIVSQAETPPFGFIDDDRGYEPLAAGEAELWVQTAPGAFQDNHSSAREDLEVRAIDVEIEILGMEGMATNIIRMGPESMFQYEITLAASVENAHDESVNWYYEVLEGPDPVEFEPFGPDNEMLFLAFAEESEGSYMIFAESGTRDGPRAGNDPVRRDHAAIILSEEEEDEPESFLYLSPRPGCIVPDQDDIQFTANLGDDEQIPFSELDYALSGPGSLSQDGLYTPSGVGRVSIAVAYNHPDFDEPLTDEVSFFVRESCGELTVSSPYFTYETGDVGADYLASSLMNVSNIFGDWPGQGPGGYIVLYASTTIGDSGEWVRELPWVRAPDFGSENWSIPDFYDSSGDQWVPTSRDVDDYSRYTLTIERTEEVLDGEVIGVVSGSFAMPMYNYSEAERLDLHPDEYTRATFTGTFENIPVSGPWYLPTPP